MSEPNEPADTVLGEESGQCGLHAHPCFDSTGNVGRSKGRYGQGRQI